jgi:transcriptional regulator with XRE-family HTH domain
MKCPKCGIEMEVEKEVEKQIFKGKEIELEYRVFVCPNCKERFIDVESLQNAWKRAWKESGVPTPDELKNARELLGITGEELAKIMGRTKSLISKLENGARRPSDKILKFYEGYVFPGPKEFFKAVENAFHEKKISEEEYLNMKRKIGEKLDDDFKENTIDEKVRIIEKEHGKELSPYNGKTLFSKENFITIVRLIMKIKKSIDKMTLFKLLFYIDAEHFEHYGESLTGLRYMANTYGPTPFDYNLIISLLEEAKILKEEGEKYNFVGESEESNLDQDTKKFILKVIETYNRDAIELSKMSHEERAWKETPKGKIITFHKNMIKSKLQTK